MKRSFIPISNHLFYCKSFIYTFFILVLFGSGTAFAQIPKVVSGTVVDDVTGETLPFVTVMLKGTSVGTVTTPEGKFTFGIPSNEGVLVFSYMGYETLELPITATGVVNVRMKLSAQALESVVITGYQTISRERVTGSVSSINAGVLQERHSPNVMANLEGRVAGLVQGRDSDGNMTLTIRGVGTLSAGLDPDSDEARRMRAPLLVVDGLPVEGSFTDLNPYDIENITILKDAAAAAMYGAKASNGVIVVTTKKASEKGRLQIDVAANFTVTQKRNVNYVDNFFMTPAQQVDAEARYYQELYVARARTDRFYGSHIGDNLAYTPIQYAYYQLALRGEGFQREVTALLNQLRQNSYAQEFADHMLLNQIEQQYNVSVRNMTEKYKSSLVINNRHNNRGIIHEGDNVFNVAYRGDYKLTGWLNFNFGLNSILQNRTTSNGRYTGLWNEMPYTTMFNPDGSQKDLSPAYSDLYNEGGFINGQRPELRPMDYYPLKEVALDKRRHDRQFSRFNAAINFDILKGLTASTSFVYETERYSNTDLSEAESYAMRNMINQFTWQDTLGKIYSDIGNGGRFYQQNYKGDYWTARGQVNYSRVFQNKHNVDFLAGLEFRETKFRGTHSLLMGYSDLLQVGTLDINFKELRENPIYNGRNSFSQMNINTSPILVITSPLSNGREQWRRFASGYTNLTYTYDGKYNAFGSFRRDFADVYGLDNKFRGKPLWSVGLSWIASREDFMRPYKWLDYLKIRGSYGITGNIRPNLTSVMTGEVFGTNTRTNEPMAQILRPANPYLTWEKTATTNFGADFGFLTASRLRGAADWYYKKSTDVFSVRKVETTSGYGELEMNVAELYNHGVELTLTYDWYQGKTRDQFRWTSSLTGAYNYNQVTYYEGRLDNAGYLEGNKFRTGYAVSGTWSYQFAGIEENGVFRNYYDGDGNKVRGGLVRIASTDALIYSGQYDPKLTMGLDNTFRYKGFSLNIMMVYYGGHVFRWGQTYLGGLTWGWSSSPRPAYQAGTMPSYLSRAWTETNKDTDVPRIFFGSDVGGGASDGENQPVQWADIYVHDADFIKIRSIVLGYDLPQNLVGKMRMRQATLRFQIDNLPALWAKNTVGVDPETAMVNPGGTLGVRRPTSFIFGLNVNF
jgi:TonB-linked SusC/RagA family outer membrane protein